MDTKTIYRVTVTGSVVNLLLLVFKFIAGVVGHSAAMIADAVHSLSDFISDVIVLLFVRIAGKPQDADHDYGHGKYETLASVIVGVILAFVGVGLAYNGLTTTYKVLFRSLQLDAPNYWALSAAVISVVSKEALFHYTVRYGRKLRSSALVANAWHHRSDAFTSIATLIGIGGAMALGADWRVLDPIAAVIVSGFIIAAAWGIMKPGFDELLEKSLPEDEKTEIEQIITTTPGVVRIHRLRTRRIGNHIAIEVHVKMPGEVSLNRAHDVASAVERRLKDALGAETHTAIHMEPL